MKLVLITNLILLLLVLLPKTTPSTTQRVVKRSSSSPFLLLLRRSRRSTLLLKEDVTKPDIKTAEDLNPIKISYNLECNYQHYFDLFTRQIPDGEEELTKDVLTSNDVPEENTRWIKYLPNLCIEVSDKKTIDIFKWDCAPNDTDMMRYGMANKIKEDNHNDDKIIHNDKGACICGRMYSTVDPGLSHPPEVLGQFRLYHSIIGLDRRLEFDEKEGKCASGLLGHCTLPFYYINKTSEEHKMMCLTGLECEKQRVGSLQRKNVDKEEYGVCRNWTNRLEPISRTNAAAASDFSIYILLVPTYLFLGLSTGHHPPPYSIVFISA